MSSSVSPALTSIDSSPSISSSDTPPRATTSPPAGTKSRESKGRITPSDTTASIRIMAMLFPRSFTQLASNHLIVTASGSSCMNGCEFTMSVSPRSGFNPIALETKFSMSCKTLSSKGCATRSPVSGSITLRSRTKSAASIRTIWFIGCDVVSTLRLTS